MFALRAETRDLFTHLDLADPYHVMLDSGLIACGGASRAPVLCFAAMTTSPGRLSLGAVPSLRVRLMGPGAAWSRPSQQSCPGQLASPGVVGNTTE